MMNEVRKWKIVIVRHHGSHYRWQLINRNGDLVMTSRETFPSYGGAKLAAQHEIVQLHQAVVIS